MWDADPQAELSPQNAIRQIFAAATLLAITAYVRSPRPLLDQTAMKKHLPKAPKNPPDICKSLGKIANLETLLMVVIKFRL
jgi:hypothetical protein